VHATTLLRKGWMELVSEPVELFTFDVSHPDRIPTRHGRERIVSAKVSQRPPLPTIVPVRTTDDAVPNSNHDDNDNDDDDDTTVVVQGVLVWWTLDLYQDVVYSTEPGGQAWQDHWRPCLHPWHTPVTAQWGDEIALHVQHSDTCITVSPHHNQNMQVANAQEDAVTVSMSKEETEGNDVTKRHKPNPEAVECAPPLPPPSRPFGSTTEWPWSPERVCQLQDAERMTKFRNAIQCAWSEWSSTHSDDAPAKFVFLDVSDFAVGATLATQICTAQSARILSLESSAGSLPTLSARWAAAILNRGRSTMTEEPCAVEILQCYTEQLTPELLHGPNDSDHTRGVDVVWAEPYYEVLEGWHLQEALNFYYIVRLLRSQQLLSDQAMILPRSCRIMGCIIQSDQLHSAYGSCGDNGAIRGMDHSYVNKLGNLFHTYDLSLPMWQYEYTVLSDVIELGVLSYSDSNFMVPFETVARGRIHTSGRCDALMAWLEYSFPKPVLSSSTEAASDVAPPSRTSTSVLSTNNQSHRQIVRMLKESARRNIARQEVGKLHFICVSRFGMDSGPDDHRFDIRIEEDEE
jgi:hypothetical protein